MDATPSPSRRLPPPPTTGSNGSGSEGRPAYGHRHVSYPHPHTHLTSSPTYRPAPPPPHFANVSSGSGSPSRRPPPDRPPPPVPPDLSKDNLIYSSPSPPVRRPLPQPGVYSQSPQSLAEYQYPTTLTASPAGPSTNRNRPIHDRLFSSPAGHMSMVMPVPMPTPPSSSEQHDMTPSPKAGLKKLRPWSLAGNRHRTGWSDKSSKSSASASSDREGYDGQRGRSESPTPTGHADGFSPITDEEDADLTVKLGKGFAKLKVQTDVDASPTASKRQSKVWPWGESTVKGKARSRDGEQDEGSSRNDWTNGYADNETDEDNQPDGYSWVDPSVVGTEKLRATPQRSARSTRSEPSSPAGVARSVLTATQQPFNLPATPKPKNTSFNLDRALQKSALDPADSYNLLLAYQTSSSGHEPITSPMTSPPMSPSSSTDHLHIRKADPEWHELVDASVLESLGRSEVRRQGLWWELIKGEVEYVRDLRTVCDSFIKPLKDVSPALIKPESRLQFFIDEVFSSAPALREAHEQLLLKLLERQRYEWPLITSATDLLLHHYLEHVDLYEQYMKNYPFAEARVRRERSRNPGFRQFVEARNTSELTRKRDLSVFLSRPITRLPRLLLLLEALLRTSPEDHPDQEEIPTVNAILTGALKGSQPGIESAEAKIKLWNVAERLMFKKGEIVELDIGDPKRSLVHAGHVFRRVRSETNWHGWQDLHAFLLDNYFIMTRDEDGGKHVVVSRPIHLDFLNLDSADAVPERRYDYLSHVRRHSRSASHNVQRSSSERLMFPFTISSNAGTTGHTYTLCTASQNARSVWKEKIEGAQTLRRFDIESNRHFAIHSIFIPPEISDPIVAADTFSWRGRETICVATMRSAWIGWRRDSKSYRELIRFQSGFISAVSIVPDFGWLLILISGSLIAYSLDELVPTHDPSTWSVKSRGGGYDLSGNDQPTAFFRVGVTKGRTMVVNASYVKNSHQTNLVFEEPLLASSSDRSYTTTPFRRFASLTIPGYATELAFFKQTVAVVTEKGFVIAEAGNPTYNAIPTFPPLVQQQSSSLLKFISGAKPMGMYQIGENEFALAYDWGACFVTKFGEVCRNGAFIRWNVTPSYVAFRPPYLLLFDESGSGRAEVRDLTNGRVCEVVKERGMKALRLSRAEQGMLVISPKGLMEIVETFEL